LDVVHTISDVRQRTGQARKAGKTVGFVPTMGALHEGHLSLVRAARRETSFVVVSLFVNPTQFGPGEDYQSYPRTAAEDRALCQKEGVDLLFAPSASEMYSEGYCTYVIQERLTERLCGLSRPGHFHGVCTVVAKLFSIVQPDISYFGQKDYQQAVVIRRMVADLNLPVEVRVLPTAREKDRLAMSSRNRGLGPAGSPERTAAVCLFRALQRAEELVRRGQTSADVIRAEMSRVITETPGTRIDYVALVHPDTLEDLDEVQCGAVAAVAVRVGPVRLIDNVILTSPASPGSAGIPAGEMNPA
jgi:pantoate--beta-alanine ligase